MASVDKVQIGSTTPAYDISPSASGTLTGYTSSDTTDASATSWTSVDPIVATTSPNTSDSNSTIFTKLTKMVKNIRFLYNKLGTTDFSSGPASSTVTGALVSLQSNKAASTHSHNTTQIPVSSTQTNSTSYIPTSSLIYSMNQTLTLINDASIYGGDYTITGTAVGALASGTTLYPDDKLNSIIKRMVGGTTYKDTLNSISDVDTFCNKYNHDNNYNGLSLGDEILINDGTYNAIWKIAGFDMEYNRTASDNTTYNNGYGICLIPKTKIGTTMKWNSSSTVTGGYKSSLMHTSNLVTVANNLQSVLGNHLVLRNVLLSSSVDSSKLSNAYTWTTAYATLMSAGQLTGTFGANTNKYDDGEANYKLPLFDHESYNTGSTFWLRSIDDSNYAFCGSRNGGISYAGVTSAYDVRPLIYLR